VTRRELTESELSIEIMTTGDSSIRGVRGPDDDAEELSRRPIRADSRRTKGRIDSHQKFRGTIQGSAKEQLYQI
jgi:hypothetical protein